MTYESQLQEKPRYSEEIVGENGVRLRKDRCEISFDYFH
jgi:hypothetical protein